MERAEQLQALDRCVLPAAAGISSMAQKGVLRAIDSFGRGGEAWPSLETLAASAGASVRTVRRAVRALEAAGVLEVERRGPLTLNHYRIRYDRLERPATVSRTTGHGVTTTGHGVTTTGHGVTTTGHGVTTTGHGGRQNVQETTKETYTNARRVLIEVLEKAGLVEPLRTLEAAERCGLSAEEIRKRVDAWRGLPDRRPGVLYNWLVKPHTFRPQPARSSGRGDALTPAEIKRNQLRYRIVRAGRAAGATPEQIEQKLELAGVA